MMCYNSFRMFKMDISTTNPLTRRPFKIFRVCMHKKCANRFPCNLQLFLGHNQLLNNYCMHISKIFQDDFTPSFGSNHLFVFCSNNIESPFHTSQHQPLNLQQIFKKCISSKYHLGFNENLDSLFIVYSSFKT